MWIAVIKKKKKGANEGTLYGRVEVACFRNARFAESQMSACAIPCASVCSYFSPLAHFEEVCDSKPQTCNAQLRKMDNDVPSSPLRDIVT